MSKGKEFFAFISYKREDEKWAKWLQRKLESFRLPSHLYGREDLPKEIRPVFRDMSEMSPGNLPKQIIEALNNSKFLIVICSPRSASSPWVDKEIKAYIEMGGVDRIIPFIIEGAPFDPLQECYPQALRDLREDQEILGTSIHEMGKEAAMVKVVSRMFGLRFDVLWQRHERYLRRRRALIIGLISAALLAAAAFISIISRQHAQLRETNWDVLRNESLLWAETAERLVEEGDSYAAVNYALDALPRDLADPDRPYTTEAEAALRKAVEGNALIRENATVESIAISPDGETIASVSFDEDCPLKLWDSNNGYPIYTFWPGEESLRCVAFSPDGKTLVTAGSYLQVWDMDNKECSLHTESPSRSEIDDLAFSPDGESLAVASEDSLYILNMVSGCFFKALPHPGGMIRSVAFSPKGNQMASCSERKIVVWNTRDWHVQRIIRMQDEAAWTAVFSPDGESIAVGMDDNTVRIRNVDSGQESFVIKPASTSANTVISVDYSPDGQSLVFSAGKDIHLWRLDGESQVFTGHEGEVLKVAFSRDGRRIVSASSDHTIRIWNVSSSWKMQTLTDQTGLSGEQSGRSQSVAFHPDGRTIVAGLGDRLVQWNAETGEVLHSYTGHSAAVTSFVFTPDGRRLFSSGNDGYLRTWDTSTGLECGPSISIDGLVAVGYSQARNAVVTVSLNGDVVLWDAKSGMRLSVFSDNILSLTYPYSLAVNSNGTRALVGTEDGGEKIDLKTGESHFLIASDIGMRYYAHRVALSPDGNLAATDNILWDFWDTDNPAGFHLESKGRIAAVAFSPDSKRIITGDNGHLVGIWDVESGKEIVSFRGHQETVTAVSSSPDGSRIVSADEDNTVCVWSYLPLQDLIDKERRVFDWPGPPQEISYFKESEE